MFTCSCGFVGNATHAKTCDVHHAEVSRVRTNIESYVSTLYNNTYSVTECIEIVKKKENTILGEMSLRKLITKFLDSRGVRKESGSVEVQQKKQKKIQATVFKKYGVINVGQLDEFGRKRFNKIPYTRLKLVEDIKEYRKQVDELTQRHVQELRRQGKIPTVCYYTDVPFADVTLTAVNPNDPLKRTVDHVVSVTKAFFLGWPPEKTADVSNFVFCLRIINTLKHNTDFEEFNTIFLPILKERLRNESSVG